MVRLFAIVIMTCTMALTPGCSGPAPKASAASLPDDFSLSITVLPGSTMQPAWYIVDPDGTLRAATGERQPQSRRPPGVRTLSRSQVRQVWEVATNAGLTDHATLTQRISPADATFPGAESIVDFSAMGRRSTAAIGSERTDQGVRPVVDLLRELAWADK